MTEGSRSRAATGQTVVTLAHGGGGRAMRDLIDHLFCAAFANADLDPSEDQARIALGRLTAIGETLAFTTDSYVVKPLFFAGGDIGKLAVYGTVNDLAVAGARPLYLSCGLVLEEGLSFEVLERVIRSMAEAARAAGVHIVTGDTKVVERGACDGLFVSTSGVGVVPRLPVVPSARSLRAGDVVLASGPLGDHGAAVLVARGDLRIEAPVESDCQPLTELVEALIARAPVRAMRDATRGGALAVFHEWAAASNVAIHVDRPKVPVRPAVRGLCDLLGLDPLALANEGRLIAAVPAEAADAALAALVAHPRGREAARIGVVREAPGGVVTESTGFGGERRLAWPSGMNLPRIC